MFPPLIRGPTPPYANVPIAPQNYQPSRFVISAVNLGPTTTVTTMVNHNYVVSQEIRLLIPNGYGCTQLNEQTGFVTQIPAANQVVITINSAQNVNQFINADLAQQPQILAIGDISSGQINANGPQMTTYVPGSFINVSNNQ
jgi:hypothetical protein